MSTLLNISSYLLVTAAFCFTSPKLNTRNQIKFNSSFLPFLSISVNSVLTRQKKKKKKKKKMSACWRFSPPYSKLQPFVLVTLVLVVSSYVSLIGTNTSWPWRFSSAGTSAGDPSVSPSFSPSSVSLSPVSEGKDDRVVVNETTTSEGVPEVEMRWTKEFSTALKPNPVKDIMPLPPHAPAEGGNNTTKNSEVELSTALDPSSNNSHGPMLELKIKEYTSLERLEAGLRRARLAIRQARDGNRTQDQDYVPIGPMYRNAGSFHRSYLEMEKTFKVFIYDEGEPPVFHNGPCKSIYSMEGNFIHMMEVNRQFRTTDPDRAHAYFLPFSVAMLVQFVYIRDSYDLGPIKRTVVDYIDVLSRKYPYWNQSSGFDHFMLACHDWGPETSRSVPNLYKNSIRVLCNANTSEGFNPSKDVSFPEINLQTGFMHGLLGGPSPSRRPILAFFAGGLHGPIRPILLQHWENKDDDLKVYKYLPEGMSYYDMMRKSKYCLCPSGYEVASPRVVEAIYTGCVPVLISDNYVPPFSDVLNWRSFSVEVPVGEIPNLKRILEGISSRQYIRMQRRIGSIRRHFEVNSPPKRYDVFHMILHSVWLRRLNVKVG